MAARGFPAAAWVLAASLLAPAPVAADSLDGSFRTIVSGRRDPRDGQAATVVPVYELVNLRARELTNPIFSHLRVIVSGWGSFDPGEPLADRDLTGDLDIAYAEGQLFDGHLRLRLGRQLLIGGSARNLQFDGLAAQALITHGVGIDVQGGVPVTPRFSAKLGDAMGGARLFWRITPESEVGVSYLHVLSDSVLDRQEAGVDARWRPLRSLTIGAHSYLSVSDERLAEADVGVQWDPTNRFGLSADYRHVAPDLFIPRSSIFSVFSEEQRNEAGGQVYFKPVPRIRFTGDYHIRLLEAGFVGHDFGAKAAVTLGRGYGTRITAEGRGLHDPDNGYVMGRLTAMHRLTPELTATLDAAGYRFENDVNGRSISGTGTLTVAYGLGSGFNAVLSGLAGVTPYLERRFEVMAKLSYGFAWNNEEPVAAGASEGEEGYDEEGYDEEGYDEEDTGEGAGETDGADEAEGEAAGADEAEGEAAGADEAEGEGVEGAAGADEAAAGEDAPEGGAEP